MRIKRFVLFILISMFAICTLALTALASPFGQKVSFDSKWSGTSGTFAPHDGLVTANTATLAEKATAPDGNPSLKITPSSSYKGASPIGIKHSSIRNMNFSLSDIKYIRYCYYYEGTYDGYAKLTFPASEFSITKERSVYSMEKVQSKSWNYLTFDVGNALFGYIFNDGTLSEVNFFPFGGAEVSSLASGKSLYLREMGLYGAENSNILAAISNGTLVQKYPVSFLSGRPDVTGEAPEMILAKVGETITLPENTFVREGYTFDGWICSVGSKIMQPGDEYTLEERNRTGGQTTAEIDFIANWVFGDGKEEIVTLPDVKRVSYAREFCGGITDGHKYKYGTLNRPMIFDGLTCVEFTPDPTGTHANTNYINFDGWVWHTMPLDLSHYKCLIIPYYFKTDKTSFGTSPYINMLGRKDDDSTALTSTLKISNSTGGLKLNQWDCLVFKFDFANNSSLNKYVRWNINTILKQIHILPFGNMTASKLSADDRLYLGDFIFLSEIPTGTVSFSKGMISGDGSGSFRPSDILTRGEAASILAKSIGFTDANLKNAESGYSDMDANDWSLPYVSFLEKKSVLIPGEKESFYPDDICTMDVYLSWATSAKINKDVATNPFGKLPVNPSSDKGVSRAEAVELASSIINDITYTAHDAVKFLGDIKLYNDINENQWYYPTVALASVPTVSAKSGNLTKVVDTIVEIPSTDTDFPEEKYIEGENYLATLDALTQERIDDILYSESEYKQKPGGKTVYVSNSSGSGTVNNCSETNPVRVSSISEISNFALNPGDVVLLKRGDIFRGSFVTKPGVTYSAFGYGDKPVIMPSPENGTGTSKWILDYEDTATGKKIWKYYRDDLLTDVGGVNLITYNSHVVAYKEIPDYRNGVFYNRADSSLEFDYKTELDHDLEFVHFANINKDGEKVLSAPDTTCVGPLYLRCDAGNPGKIYSTIEFNSNEHAIRLNGSHGVTIDNLCLKYFGRHGISAGTVHNLTVRNCEIGWGGGSIQGYKDGRVTRFGNGVEIYGALVNYVIENCYVYEIYDAGITHQISSSSLGNYFMDGVYYLDNVLINSTYNIEYFMSKNDAGSDGVVAPCERYMKDVYFTNNITRGAGYGWGVQRPDNAPSNIKGWTHHNLCHNQVYENNIFDRCVDLQNYSTDYTIMCGSTYESSSPYMKNNIFVQVPGRTVMMYVTPNYKCDLDSEQLINTIGGTGNKVYFCRDDSADYEHMVWWKDR